MGGAEEALVCCSLLILVMGRRARQNRVPGGAQTVNGCVSSLRRAGPGMTGFAVRLFATTRPQRYSGTTQGWVPPLVLR